jgi:TRAP-type C4-dicarboxylate transport system substrate-binding protein
MQKRKKFILLGGVCLALMMAVHPIAPTHALAAQQIRLKFSNFFPPASDLSKICEEFSADIEKRTGGRVKITYYPGGSLLKAPAMFMGVVEGASDIGFASIMYTPGRMPVTEVLGLTRGSVVTLPMTSTSNSSRKSGIRCMFFGCIPPGSLFL